MTRFVAGLSLFTILVLSVFAPSQSTAQAVDPTGGAGVKAYGAYHGSSIEHISLETSKLITNIPLISYPQRGGKLRVEFALHWYNPVYTYTHICNPDLNPRCLTTFGSVQPPALFQALEGLPYVTGVFVNNNPLSQNNTIWDSDGGGHQLAPVDSAGQGPIYRSIDATGYWLNGATSSNPTNTIIDANGIRYTYPASGTVTAEDSNGNEMTISPQTSVVDTLNRTIPFPLSTSNPTTSNFSGCTGPLPTTSARLWHPPDQNGGTVTFKFCYASVHIQINGLPSPCPAETQCSEPNGNFAELQSIVLPNGTAWEFEYNGGGNPNDATVNAGLLSKITLPTGGTISYAWNTPPENTVVSAFTVYQPAVISRTVNANDGSGAKTWSYAGGTITDPLGNNEVHTLTELARCQGVGTFYDTQDQYYQGSVAPANLLKTVNTTYNSVANPYLVLPSCTGVVNVGPLTTTTTWPNGQVSKETKSYDSGFANYPGGYLENDLYGKVISDTFYDYGTNTPGPILKQVNNTWLALTNSNYLSGNLLNLLSTQQTVNASNTQQAYTSNTYDGQSLLSSGVTTHFTTAPNGTYRGNLTGIGRWLNPTNSNLTTTNTYYDAGMLGKTQDPVGNSTQFFYSTTYAGGYLTSLQNALNYTSTFTYDYNTGEMLTKVDVNKQPTSYSYDNMRRLIQVQYPDGGQTSYQFTETAIPYTVTTTEAITSSLNKTTIESVDGFGRETESQLTSDPQGTVYVYTAYDGDGREYAVTNPYRTTSDPTYGTTTYIYDALGRTTKVTHPDGTYATTSYTGRATSVQDEGNGTAAPVRRISQVDGMGRLTSVCEVTSSTQLGPGGTPGACAQDVAATGFLTSYTYDPLGNLLAVSQGSLGQRTFSYDSLSRLLCAANPETGTATCPNPGTGIYTAGTTGYAYDADGNLTQRTRPSPNLSPPNPTVTTAYQYDALNRLTQKSYSDTVPTYTNGTPTVMFGYDQTSITMGAQTFGISNSIGRVSWSAPLTQAGNTITMKALSYDPIGRVKQLWQHTPAQGPSNIAIAYDYDTIGDELDFVVGNGVPGSTEYVSTYNAAGRLTSFTTPSYNDATNPSNLLTNAQYDPFGHLVAATFANGLSQSWAYDNRGRPHAMAVGTTCSAGTCSGSMVYSYSVGYTGDSDVLSATDSVNGTWSYTYDGFNRLATSNCSANCPSGSSTEGFSYGYDRNGNRWNQTVTAGSGGNSLLTFNGPGNMPNNRIDGYSYDAAGNLLNDGFHNYKYDAENRLISVDTGAITYIYDADGQRVEKNTGGALSDYNYDREGRVLIYNNPASSTHNETYAAGLHLGTYILNSAGTDTIFYYDHSDWLGTERARINLSGTACEKIATLPFGDGQTVAGTCGDISPMHFTGKERDTESGLDNFGARYESSALGRFMTPDWAARPISVPYATFGDPQTLNLYSYVENAPLNRIDADGHAQQQSGDAEAGCFNGAASCTMSPNQQPPAQNLAAQDRFLWHNLRAYQLRYRKWRQQYSKFRNPGSNLTRSELQEWCSSRNGRVERLVVMHSKLHG